MVVHFFAVDQLRGFSSLYSQSSTESDMHFFSFTATLLSSKSGALQSLMVVVEVVWRVCTFQVFRLCQERVFLVRVRGEDGLEVVEAV